MSFEEITALRHVAFYSISQTIIIITSAMRSLSSPPVRYGPTTTAAINDIFFLITKKTEKLTPNKQRTTFEYHKWKTCYIIIRLHLFGEIFPWAEYDGSSWREKGSMQPREWNERKRKLSTAPAIDIATVTERLPMGNGKKSTSAYLSGNEEEGRLTLEINIIECKMKKEQSE